MIKLILGYVLCGIAIFGGLVFIAFVLDIGLFGSAAQQIFGVPFQSNRYTGGGASTSPIFLGLCALAGVYLIRDKEK